MISWNSKNSENNESLTGHIPNVAPDPLHADQTFRPAALGHHDDIALSLRAALRRGSLVAQELARDPRFRHDTLHLHGAQHTARDPRHILSWRQATEAVGEIRGCHRYPLQSCR